MNKDTTIKQKLEIQKSERISAKEAALSAKKYFEDLSQERKVRINVEEVELSEDRAYWLITLGIYEPTRSLAFVSRGLDEIVNYKVFKVDTKTGEVEGMKFRQPLFPNQQSLPQN